MSMLVSATSADGGGIAREPVAEAIRTPPEDIGVVMSNNSSASRGRSKRTDVCMGRGDLIKRLLGDVGFSACHCCPTTPTKPTKAPGVTIRHCLPIGSLARFACGACFDLRLTLLPTDKHMLQHSTHRDGILFSTVYLHRR
jgi:hypothetical protein